MEMMTFENGSRWLRADFHLHTKADKEFIYNDEKINFINAYVEQLSSQEIGIGVITNHNKFDKDEYCALKKVALKKNIGLFAGVEYSTREGIHILIVFDDAWYKGDVNHIQEFLNHAFYNIRNYDIPDYPNSNLTLKETVLALNQKELDYFIILAHVDDKNGFFIESGVATNEFNTLIGDPEFKDRVIGVQKCTKPEHYDKLCEAIDYKLAYVEGSDNAHAGITGLGASKKRTYLKIGAFNFEALRFALTDIDDRLRPKDKPEIKNSYIKSISYEGGLLDGKTIHFSPELNTLIGIRGSGKSSIIEVLRYALNIPLGLQAMDNDYKSNLIQRMMGSGGKVTVSIVNNLGEEYIVKKIYGQKEDIYKDGTLLHDITVDAILKQPVYFGQKDLSNKDVDFEADLVKKLIGNKLTSIKERIEQKKIQISGLISDIFKIRDLEELKPEVSQQIANDEFKLTKYKENGIEDKLKRQTLFDSDEARLKEYEGLIKKYSDTFELFVSQNDEWMNTQISGSDENAPIFAQANILLKELQEKQAALKVLSDSIKDCKARYTGNITLLLTKKESLKEEFAKIKREINVPSLNPDEFINVNRRIETSKLKLKAIEKEEERKKQLNGQLMTALTELEELWHEEFVTLQKEIEKINQSERRLQVKLIYKGRKDKFLDYLKFQFKGCNIRESSFVTVTEKYTDFIQLYKEFKKLKDILNDNQYVLFEGKFRENLAEVVTTQIDNTLTIEYDGKPLKDHSLGQRASALILFLLAQKDNDILIIDQPEDDLDNQTIYDNVIKEIKKLKGNMQFIFATHNANIPVLGDCERIVACDYDEGRDIKIDSGTIDEPVSQQKIVAIMEGGKDALRMRRQIYNIWKIK